MRLSLAQRLTYGLVAAAALMIAGEVAARIIDDVREGVPFGASPQFEDLITHDANGTHGTANGRFEGFQLNSAGFRSPEAALEVKPGCVRVMALGASETLGTGSGASGNEYPAQLQDSLSKHGCFTVLNAGIQGIGLRSLLHFWESWASRFHPDIVVVMATPAMYLLDPLPPYSSGHDVAHPVPRFRFASRLAAHIHERLHFPQFVIRQRVDNLLASLTEGRPSSWYYSSVPRERLELYRHDLDSLLTEIRASGSTPVLGAYPMRFGHALAPEDSGLVAQWREYAPRALPGTLLQFHWDARDVVLELGRQRHVTTVDLPAALNGHAELFDDYAHYTAAGARVVAGLVARGVLDAASGSRSLVAQTLK